MAQLYDVTILTVRPGMHPRALEVLGNSPGADLLACWYGGHRLNGQPSDSRSRGEHSNADRLHHRI